MQPASSAEKRVRTGHDWWFWFYFWLVENVARNVLANQKPLYNNGENACDVTSLLPVDKTFEKLIAIAILICNISWLVFSAFVND